MRSASSYKTFDEFAEDETAVKAPPQSDKTPSPPPQHSPSYPPSLAEYNHNDHARPPFRHAYDTPQDMHHQPPGAMAPVSHGPMVMMNYPHAPSPFPYPPQPQQNMYYQHHSPPPQTTYLPLPPRKIYMHNTHNTHNTHNVHDEYERLSSRSLRGGRRSGEGDDDDDEWYEVREGADGTSNVTVKSGHVFNGLISDVRLLKYVIGGLAVISLIQFILIFVLVMRQ